MYLPFFSLTNNSAASLPLSFGFVWLIQNEFTRLGALLRRPMLFSCIRDKSRTSVISVSERILVSVSSWSISKPVVLLDTVVCVDGTRVTSTALAAENFNVRDQIFDVDELLCIAVMFAVDDEDNEDKPE